MGRGPPIERKVKASSPPRKRGSRSVGSRFRGNDGGPVTFDGAHSLSSFGAPGRKSRHSRESGNPVRTRDVDLRLRGGDSLNLISMGGSQASGHSG
jgi:hypothetical protein